MYAPGVEKENAVHIKDGSLRRDFYSKLKLCSSSGFLSAQGTVVSLYPVAGSGVHQTTPDALNFLQQFSFHFNGTEVPPIEVAVFSVYLRAKGVVTSPRLFSPGNCFQGVTRYLSYSSSLSQIRTQSR
jgi:hypothetical protein